MGYTVATFKCFVAFFGLFMIYEIMYMMYHFIPGYAFNSTLFVQHDQVSIGANDSRYEKKLFDKLSPEYNDTVELKKILMWSGCWGKNYYCSLYEGGREPFFKLKCPESRCEITEDKKVLGSAAAVIFYSRSTPRLKDIPTVRKPSQRYIFYNHEVSFGSYLGQMKDFFNMTITYRKDSDLQFLHMRYLNRSQQSSGENQVPPYSPLKDGQEIIKKRKPVAWMVSNCKTSSQRQAYAKELSKYIQVDIYGACGPLKFKKGPPPNTLLESVKMIEENYNFYLSFENTICPDYVTEKLEKILKINTIPIVYGGGNYSEIAPPHSVIDVEDFPNPKDLAAYLKDLLSSFDKYSKYLEWKKHYYMTEDMDDKRFLCDVCQILNDDSYPPKVHHNVLDWWGKGGTDKNCVRDKMKELQNRGGWGK